MNLRKKNLLITGLPGVGKTTLVKKLSEALKSLHPAGFYTEEIREVGERKGFELFSLDGKRGLLSHKEVQSSYRVGQYKVDIKGFEDFLGSISFFDPSTRLIIIDEIGKMECLSTAFRKIMTSFLDSSSPVIATIALRGEGYISEVKHRHDVSLTELTVRNRNIILPETADRVRSLMRF